MTLSSPSRHAQYTRHLRPFAIAAYRLFIALSALALFRVASSLTGVDAVPPHCKCTLIRIR